MEHVTPGTLAMMQVDQHDFEVAKLKHVVSALIPWVGASPMEAAQETLADACEAIGVHPLDWTSHPKVLLSRRPYLDRRLKGRT